VVNLGIDWSNRTFAYTRDSCEADNGETHRDYRYGGNVHVSNGSFDWRRERPNWQVPWYEGGERFVWTPNAYHYACDPNSRY